MTDVPKLEALDENLLFKWRWFTDPISPWVLKEIGDEHISQVVTVQLELQRSIYHAKIQAVDHLLRLVGQKAE